MRLSELLRLVWINLSQNKFKVILTSIGIVVGAATIMMVIAIGTGGKMEVAEQFKNLNAGAIDISYEVAGSSSETGESVTGTVAEEVSGSGMFGGGMPNGGVMTGGSRPSGGASGGTTFTRGSDAEFSFSIPGGSDAFNFIMGGESEADSRINQETVTLTEEDVEDLEVFVPGMSDITISYSTKTLVEGGELEAATSYTIGGTKDNYLEISNLSLSIGDFFTEENEENREKVCVLGANVAKEIFGSAYDAYDGTIYLDGRPYVVSGVLDEMGTVASGISPDEAIFIPYSTGIKYLTGDSVSPTVTVISDKVSDVDGVISNIEAVLLDSYPNTEFNITDAGSKMEAASKSNDTLTLLLIAMAIIVFIVGGIGIMNVLFVSVKERTNEIGILKALGCKQSNILAEFLYEAACISLVGAILGVLVALGITPLVEQFSVRVELSVSGAIISLAFGVITGTIFGFYPAYKASRLVPVVALNQE